jgi:hypothetical protein
MYDHAFKVFKTNNLVYFLAHGHEFVEKRQFNSGKVVTQFHVQVDCPVVGSGLPWIFGIRKSCFAREKHLKAMQHIFKVNTVQVPDLLVNN